MKLFRRNGIKHDNHMILIYLMRFYYFKNMDQTYDYFYWRLLNDLKVWYLVIFQTILSNILCYYESYIWVGLMWTKVKESNVINMESNVINMDLDRGVKCGHKNHSNPKLLKTRVCSVIRVNNIWKKTMKQKLLILINFLWKRELHI